MAFADTRIQMKVFGEKLIGYDPNSEKSLEQLVRDVKIAIGFLMKHIIPSYMKTYAGTPKIKQIEYCVVFIKEALNVIDKNHVMAGKWLLKASNELYGL